MSLVAVDQITRSAPGRQSTQLPCREADPDLFFSINPAEVARAKSLCACCPVRVACLRGAIERLEVWGTWGGELFDGGRIVAFKRGRGRPPKDSSGSGSGVGRARVPAQVQIPENSMPTKP